MTVGTRLALAVQKVTATLATHNARPPRNTRSHWRPSRLRTLVVIALSVIGSSFRGATANPSRRLAPGTRKHAVLAPEEVCSGPPPAAGRGRCDEGRPRLPRVALLDRLTVAVGVADLERRHVRLGQPPSSCLLVVSIEGDEDINTFAPRQSRRGNDEVGAGPAATVRPGRSRR